MSQMTDPDSLPKPRSRDSLSTTTVWLIAAIILFVAMVGFLRAQT
jgi:hypothetical protein